MPGSILVKSILNKTKKRDSWFWCDYTINPFSACSFNCIYCYIRGSKYGENMEDKVSVKSNALEVLDKQLSLRAKKKQYGFVVVASATDPYLHFENELQLTRNILQLLLKYRFPVHVITKSDRVERDFDLLQEINREAILPADLESRSRDRVFISFSFSTTDNAIAKIFEPGAPLPSVRLKALHSAVGTGFMTGVSLMPLIPFVTDNGQQLEEMFSLFSTSQAQYVLPASLTLFGRDKADSKTLVLRAVEKHYPHLLQKYHRFFDVSDYMPEYYHQALKQKMNELSNRFKIPLSIGGKFFGQ